MQLFPIGKVYDFMSRRWLFMGLSVLLTLVSIVLLFYPGPRLGTDFIGGTEVEVAFNQATSSAQISAAVMKGDFSRPDVIRVQNDQDAHRYMIRVQEVSTISEQQQREIERRLCIGEQKPQGCEHHGVDVKFSPGGEKVTVRYLDAPDVGWVRSQLDGLSGVVLLASEDNPKITDTRDNRVEIRLTSRGDQLMDTLRAGLPDGAVPDRALRTEWIGPKAGAQLRDSALKSIVITLIFIMAYVALRFDLRFAPGGVLALVHDSIVTVGVLIVLKREVNLTTVAAVLTIIGYSVNDTVVVYDRVRENLGKMRGDTFSRLINISISEMLGRTVLTSGTTIMVLVCFFIWGTGSLRDFALTLIIGLVLGVYSSIYVALPLTEYLDRKFFASEKKGAIART